MTELRELLARAIDPNFDNIPKINLYKQRLDDVFYQVDAILAALDAAGLVVVPRPPTEAMCEAGMDYMPGCDPTDCMVKAGVAFEVMLAASPYAKKEME